MTAKVRNSLLVLSFLFNLSTQYGLDSQAGGFGGDGALKKSAAE
jgi:hypothetical protein